MLHRSLADLPRSLFHRNSCAMCVPPPQLHAPRLVRASVSQRQQQGLARISVGQGQQQGLARMSRDLGSPESHMGLMAATSAFLPPQLCSRLLGNNPVHLALVGAVSRLSLCQTVFGTYSAQAG